MFRPSLSAIEQPAYQMGMSAVQLLLKSTRSEDGKARDGARQIQLKSCMHIRESTGPAPQD